MHLTQQQQLNQMCPPPLGPQAAAWFMNHHHSQPTGLPLPPPSPASYHTSTYHQQHQSYYTHNNTGNSNNGHPHSNLHNPSTIVATTLSVNNAAQMQQQSQQNHLHQHHQTAQHYNYPTYHQHASLQQPQQAIHNQQQFNQPHHHTQPLAIQQPQSQHVHLQQQQSSPILHQHQSQLSPHTSQPRPSSTLHQHQQPSPNYQQHSPHLTSPSLQPSPVLHHQTTPQQQHSPLSRHQPTPPHHTPTPNSTSQPNSHSGMRPASVKESTINHLSNILRTEVRVLEFNRRLQSRPSSRYRNNPLPSYDQYDESHWWDEFTTDFFKEDATLTLYLQADDRPVKYVLKRGLIARFFRSYFDGGVTELSINLKNSNELRSQHQTILLDCEHATIITKNLLKHPKVSLAPRVVVCSEGHLSLEFVGANLETMLIKSWKFRINVCREYIDRSITSIGLPNTLLVEPTTFQGLPSSTMFYLRMCSIMEPMQELMSQHKQNNMEPKACLKKLLYDRYRFKSDVETKVTPTRRRKRKSPTSPANANVQVNPKRSKSTSISSINSNMTNTSPPESTNLPPLDVMVVGEPASMSHEYKDENERSITKVDNSNYIAPKEEIPSIPEIFDEPIPNVVSSERIELDEEKDSKQNNEDEDTTQLNSNGDGDRELTQEQSRSASVEIKEEPAGNDPPNVSEPPEISDEKLKTQVHNKLSPSRPFSEESIEKEDNSSLLSSDETPVNSAIHNIMNSIPEDREDTCRSISCDPIVSKLPPSCINKSSSTINGSGNKQNRRRSSERKETLREGLMRTSDFVVAMKDLKCEHPHLWRITTGNNLLQQFEPKTQNGVVLYENTNQYAGWNPEIKKDYVGVDVKLTQHTRNQITVERLLLNFQNLDDADAFYDKHFVIYLQILISTALDPKFWDSIEIEAKHHDYFLTSHRIIEDITKRFKIKLSNKLKLSEAALKNVEKYPNLLIKTVDKIDKDQLCRACNTNESTQIVEFENRSYDLHSYKPVKVSNELSKTDDRDLHNNLCDSCLDIVKNYSEIHHMGWRFYNLAQKKVELHRTKGKPINAILDECLKDEDWLAQIYAERDALWSKVENIQ